MLIPPGNERVIKAPTPNVAVDQREMQVPKDRLLINERV